ncbi:MAG: SDR family NAD(P)-dependent oxidoreductase [Candidatus Bathyarchaeia archaeon]
MQNSKVLVTGGAGFIGSHVVDRLVAGGCKVSVLDNLSTGMVGNIQRHLKNGKVEFFEGDVRDRGIVKEVVKEVEAVVHLAAVASVPFSVSHPILTNRVNVEGTLNLLEACSDTNTERLLYISSCAVYGEPRFLPINEEHPTCPRSPYAASKLAAEYYCRAFGHSFGLETVTLRLFNVYGPRQRSDDMYGGVVTRFVDNLLHGRPLVVYGDGLQTRDFVHVRDVAEAVWLALNVKGVNGEVFNVGCGAPVEVNQLANMLIASSGSKTKIVYEEARLGDLKHSHADVAKAKNRLGFKPKISLDRGLPDLLRERKTCR